jgi:hypothetical protein
MSKTISAGKNPVIEVDTISGDLSVVGWEGDEILIPKTGITRKIRAIVDTEYFWSYNSEKNSRSIKKFMAFIKIIASFMDNIYTNNPHLRYQLLP